MLAKAGLLNLFFIHVALFEPTYSHGCAGQYKRDYIACKIHREKSRSFSEQNSRKRQAVTEASEHQQKHLLLLDEIKHHPHSVNQHDSCYPDTLLLKATDNRHTWLISIWNQGCSPVIPCINLLCYCYSSKAVQER